MQPDPGPLLDALGIRTPLIGCYDAPEAGPFAPLVAPQPDKMTCVFAFYENWLKGETLDLTRENFGCAGAGRALCGVATRSRAELVRFLVDAEGLRASHELMEAWLDHGRTYRPEHAHVLIGPLKPDQEACLKTVTFLVDPDQLSALIIGAHYHHRPTDPAPVIAPFGAGCMQLLTVFDDLDGAQAAIGATDIAMRQHLPPSLMAFTVTRPLFAELCALDERSFLFKPFWKRLLKARGHSHP